jgi:uncharacterized protein (DUF885 family)
MRDSPLAVLPIVIVTAALTAAALASCTGSAAPDEPTIRPTAAATVAATTPDVPLATSELPVQSDELNLDEFIEASFAALLQRDPERIIRNGLQDVYPLEGVTLTDISDAYEQETHQLHAAILDILRTYDRTELTPEQQISYDVYEWYLDDLVRGHTFTYHSYPVTQLPSSTDGMLRLFFEDMHPVTSRQEAEEYVTRLSLVERKFEQLIEGLQLREEAGIVPPYLVVEGALNIARGIAISSATSTPFYTALAGKLDELEGLSEPNRQELLEAAAAAIDASVIPGYQNLARQLQHMLTLAPDDVGVWQYPAGDDYYAYLLRHHTTTELTAIEIHQMGLEELERIHAEMRAAFGELGYSPDDSIEDLYRQAARDGGFVSGNELIEAYEEIIAQADAGLDTAFDVRPEAEVIVIGAPAGGFYVSGSLDGSRPGAFYATQGGRSLFNMASLTYHETVPGHHFQIAIAQELDLPLFRNMVSFTGYIEGWALYAERLAWELGWYNDDPYGNLGRLQYEAYRAARLVVDTGIHALGWPYDQAVDFFDENTGLGHGRFSIGRYTAMPGQATAYMVGMLRILELRQMAMDQLGDQFDLTEFHHVVLTNGSMPLDILEQLVLQYIEDKLENPS